MFAVAVLTVGAFAIRQLAAGRLRDPGVMGNCPPRSDNGFTPKGGVRIGLGRN